MHEAQMHKDNCWLTLTYDDAHVPSDGSLRYKDFQLFMRYLRRRAAARFFMCGEYGDQLGRPHFHVGIFGVTFRSDWRPWRKTGAGFQLYRSAAWESLWRHGSCEVGELTLESASYMARYTFKKITGDMADEHYKTVDANTGEITWKVPEFCHMSLRPGIGASWFRAFQSDVYPHDRVVVRGVESKPPRYYDKLLKEVNPLLLEELQQERLIRARERFPDNTDARLAVKETVLKARLSFKKRS